MASRMPGWPKTRKKFYPLANGNFLKGGKIITPHKFRKDMLHCIHAGHFGTEKNKHQTRAIIFWHGLSRQIAEIIMKCDICQTHHNSNQKEPLLLQAVPENPWQTVATDLFHWKSEKYIVICDYLTRYFENEFLCSISTAQATALKISSGLQIHGVFSTSPQVLTTPRVMA